MNDLNTVYQVMIVMIASMGIVSVCLTLYWFIEFSVNRLTCFFYGHWWSNWQTFEADVNEVFSIRHCKRCGLVHEQEEFDGMNGWEDIFYRGKKNLPSTTNMRKK